MSSKRLSRVALAEYPLDYDGVYRASPHQLSTFDLSKDSERFMAVAPTKPGLIYVDPPWGAALASGFRTKAGVVGQKADWPALVRELARILVWAGSPAVVEMGMRWVDQVVALFQEFSAMADISTVLGVGAGKSRMCYIIVAAQPEHHAALSKVLRDRSGIHTPGLAMDAVFSGRQGVVMDPMCGRGLTAEYALAKGHVFIGNELAPYRAAATYKLLKETVR